VVIIGDGGKYVEALPDVALLLPPFSAADARDAILSLRIAPIRHWRIRQARHRSYMRRRAALHPSSSGCWMQA